MANNIYEIPVWTALTYYAKHSIVSRNGLYYYSLINHTSSVNFTNDIAAGKLGGYLLNNSENKPYFLWLPSYRNNTESEPKVKKIQFGDSYAQRLNDGINNIMPVLNLSFDEISLDECTAILHFLEARAGVESFLYLPPAPRGSIGRFICSKWNDTQNFVNNFTITAVFERVVV